MAAARRPRALILAIAVAAGLIWSGGAASGSDAPQINATSSDMFELVARFQGAWAQIAGTPHEWWSPRTGYYHADHATAREPFVTVYDGVTMTRRLDGKLFRV